MNILALDLGTDTGYAHGDSKEKQPALGHWTLGTKQEITDWGKTRLTRRSDPRVSRLFGLLGNFTPDLVVFEDVQFQTFTMQTQLWSALRAAVWLAFRDKTIDCVDVSTLKKFATGHGFAKKEQMISSLLKLSPGLGGATLTDDEADAAWLWYWAKKHICLTK